MDKLITFLLFIGVSIGCLSQKSIQKIDTVYVKYKGEQTYLPKIDTVWNTYDYRGHDHSLKDDFECLFEGTVKNGKPYDGKAYCFDKNGLLDHIFIYSKGKIEDAEKK